MEKLIIDNYQSIVDRGLITPQTMFSEFTAKLHEELVELEMAYLQKGEVDEYEIADIILTALNMAHHYNKNIEFVLKDKIKINKKRK